MLVSFEHACMRAWMYRFYRRCGSAYLSIFLVVELSPGAVHRQCWQGQRNLNESENVLEHQIFIHLACTHCGLALL